MEEYLKRVLHEPPYLKFDERFFMEDYNDSIMDEMPHNIPFKEIEIEQYKHGPHINFKIAI